MSAVLDSLDELQPVPRRGKFFAELVTRQELASAHGVILPAEDPNAPTTAPKRARVIQLGDQPIDDFGNVVPWDFGVGDEIIVPFHAGHTYTWMSQPGIEESIWILDEREVITVFRDRANPPTTNTSTN
jgi:co-chaperonin GroES (HSP10)